MGKKRKTSKASYQRSLLDSAIDNISKQIEQERAMAQAQAEAQAKAQIPDYAKGMTSEKIDSIIDSYNSQQNIPKLEQNTTPTPSISEELERMKKAKADTTTPRTEGEQKAIDTYYDSLVKASGQQPTTSAPTSTPSVDYKAEIDRMNALKADTSAIRTEGENKAIDDYLKGLTDAQAYIDSQKPRQTVSKSKQTTSKPKEKSRLEIAKEKGAKALEDVRSGKIVSQRVLSTNEQRDYERAKQAEALREEREKKTTETVSKEVPKTAATKENTTLSYGTLTVPTANPETKEGYNYEELKLPETKAELKDNTSGVNALANPLANPDYNPYLRDITSNEAIKASRNMADDLMLLQAENRNLNPKAVLSDYGITSDKWEDASKDLESYNKYDRGSSFSVGLPSLIYNKIQKGATKKEIQEEYGLSDEQFEALYNDFTYANENRKGQISDRNAKEYAEEHPFLGSLGSVGTGLISAATAIPELGYDLTSGRTKMSAYEGAHKFSKRKDAARAGVKENIDNEILQGAYDMGMGLTDLGASSLVTLATGGAVNPATTLALQTANSASTQALDNSSTPKQAALFGALSGVTDYYFNKVGLDAAKSLAIDKLALNGIPKAIATNLIAGSAEAGENVLQDLTQSVLDDIINHEHSALRTAYNSYLAQGQSESEALGNVLSDYASQLIVSGGTGFLMGSATHAGTSAINHIKANGLNPLEEKITDTNVKNNAANPLDNGVSAVDNGIKGEVQNGTERIDTTGNTTDIRPEQPRPVLPENSGEVPQPGQNGQGNRTDTRRPVVDNNLRSQMNEAGVKDVQLRDYSDDYKSYSDALSEARKANPHGAFVDPQSVEDLQKYNTKTFMSENGGCGVAIKDNGNIVGVFKNTDKYANADEAKGAARDELISARINGGDRLDCYGSDLVDMYAPAGFEPTHKVRYEKGINPEMDEWCKQDIDRQIKEGKIKDESEYKYPDIIFMKVRDGESIEDTLNLIKNKGVPDYDETLRNMPYTEAKDGKNAYEVAEAERDAMIGKQPTSEGAFFDGEKVTNEPVNNQPTNPDKRLSNVYTNHLTKLKVVEMANSTSRINAEYDVHHAKDVIDTATKNYMEHGDEWSDDVVSGKTRIDGDDDVAEATLCLMGLRDQITQAQESNADKSFIASLVSKRDALARKLRFAGTRLGEAVKAFDYFRGTAEGAVLNAQKLYDQMGKKWAEKKGNAKNVELNGRLAAAFNKINNPETNTRGRVKKSFDQIRQEVKNTIDYNKATKLFSDSDIDYLAHMIQNNLSMDELTSLLNTKMATGVFDIPQETIDKVNELFDRAQQFGENSKQRVDLETEAFWELANAGNQKSSLADKFEAWRFLAMLGNPKTHIRNIIGNTLFSTVTGVSNNLAAAMEAGANGISKLTRNGQGIERTKSILNLANENDRALLKASKQDAIDNAYRQLVGQKYNDSRSVKNFIKEQREVFNSEVLNAANELNNKALTAEDTMAMKNKYKTSLAGWLKANGLDASIFDDEKAYRKLLKESDTELVDNAKLEELKQRVDKLEQGRKYAIEQAKYAAFHEDNAVAEMFSEWSRGALQSDKKAKRIAGRMIEGVLPFKKTPANILRSGAEYSPLNIVNDIYHLVQMGKGQESISKYFESLSKTVTGTALAYAGMLLYDKGILNMSEDDDSKWQDALEGRQNFSIKIGNHTATIDFAVPSVMPLFLGAQTKKIWDSVPGNDTQTFIEHFGELLEDAKNHPMDSFADLLTAGSRLLSPVAETSMLSGVNDTLESVANGEGVDAFANLGAAALTGYATQGIPTVLGQVARTVDPTRRSTYSDNNTVLGRTWDNQVEKIQNKIPFLSMLNEPYLDAYGREQKNSPVNTGNDVIDYLGNFAYQSLWPSYIQKIEQTPADINARAVYNGLDADGKPIRDDQVFANIAPLSINGERLSDEDNYKYTKENGEANLAIRNALTTQDWYNALSPTEQNDILKSVDTLTKNYGQYTVAPDSLNISDELQDFLDAGYGYDEKGFLTKDLDSGVNAVLENIEAKYNPYGLDTKRYKELKANGEDLAKYDGFKQALEASDAEDGKKTEEVWLGQSIDGCYFGRGAEGVQKYTDYKNACKNLDINESKGSMQAYLNDGGEQGLVKYQEHRQKATDAGYVTQDGEPNVDRYDKVYGIMQNDSDTKNFSTFYDQMEKNKTTKEEDYIPILESMNLSTEQRGKYAYAMASKVGETGQKTVDDYGYAGYYLYKSLSNVQDLNHDGEIKDDRKRVLNEWDIYIDDADTADAYEYFMKLFYPKNWYK